MTVEVDPEDFNREFSVLRSKRQAGREKRKEMFGTAKMSEYVSSRERRENEFAFDYDEVIREMHKREEDREDAVLQAEQLRAQMVHDHNRKHPKHQHIIDVDPNEVPQNEP